MTRILGNLNIVISFSMLSTALQFEHLYPQASILSEAVYPLIHSLMSIYPVYRTAFLGIEIDRSIKLSKVRDLCLQDMHSSLLQSWPSKRSVIKSIYSVSCGAGGVMNRKHKWVWCISVLCIIISSGDTVSNVCHVVWIIRIIHIRHKSPIPMGFIK